MSTGNQPAGRDRYWEELCSLDPAEVCRRALVSYDSSLSRYRVDFCGEEHHVFPEKATVLRADTDEESDCAMLLLLYLLRASDMPVSGSWVTEKGLPGGQLFFAGPHAMPIHRIIEMFGDSPEALLESGRGLGGCPAEYGDASVEIQALPRVSVVIVLWQGDEEFPARAGFLYDSTAAEHLPLDVILDLTHRVLARLTPRKDI